MHKAIICGVIDAARNQVLLPVSVKVLPSEEPAAYLQLRHWNTRARRFRHGRIG